MEGVRFVGLCTLLLTLVLYVPANAQVITTCTNSMVNSFTPCLSFITSGNGTSPTVDCCNSLKSLTNASTECACNILTGNVPFQIPINRTLAVSLPQACNSSALPLQCKAGVTPVAPVPAPASGPAPSAMSPSATPTASPPVPEAVTPTSEPSTPSTLSPPTSTPSGTGTTSPDIRPTVTPNSAAATSTFSLQALLLSTIGVLALNYY